jgi:hypothetical protein
MDDYGYTDAVKEITTGVILLAAVTLDSVAARIDETALRAAQERKDAVAAYELVYAALGA